MNKLNENPNGRYRSVSGACSETNISRGVLMRISSEANAIIRIGRSVKIDMPALYSYIDKVYKTGNEGIELQKAQAKM